MRPRSPRRQPAFEGSIEVWRSAEFDGIEMCRGRNVTHSYPRHWHDELHFSFVTRGAGYLQCFGRSHLTPPGSLSMVAPGEVHSNWSDQEAGCSFRSMYVDMRRVQEVAAGIREKFPFAPDFKDCLPGSLEFQRSYLQLHKSFEVSHTRLRRDFLLFAFLGRLRLRYSRPGSGPPRVGREHVAVQRIRDFIAAHYADGISLRDLAQLANLNPFHLNHAFGRAQGIPPHAYQIQLRITHAKRLLRQRVPISEVAAATGFVDQSHLGRTFRRVVGVTPAHYALASQERTRPMAAALT